MDNTKMNNDIMEVIVDNLPQATVGAFKKRIDELEKEASKVKPLQTKFEKLLEDNKKLASELGKYQELETKTRLLDKREKEIAVTENQLNTTRKVLEVREELNNQRVQDHKEMMQTVFKNPTLRKEIFTNKSNFHRDGSSESSNSNTSITTSEE